MVSVTMIFYTTLAVFLVNVAAESFLNIEDIPIENFEPSDLQENAMDLELLPKKPPRSAGLEDDPKEHFFRYIKSYNGNFDDYNVGDESSNVPQPGGFRSFNKDERFSSRTKRNAPDIADTTNEELHILNGIEKQLGKPLELSVLDPENSTETTESVMETTIATTLSAVSDSSNFLINDFIRFKRESTTEDMERSTKDSNKFDDIETLQDTNNSSSFDGNRPKRDQMQKNHSGKMLLDPNNLAQDGSREPRGATKEQWVKHVYPVRRGDDVYDDNSPASSENARAPRVHFVTQRRSELPPTPTYRSYDREARARNLNKELSRDLSRDMSREMDYYYQPRYTRHYNSMPPPPPSHYRYDDYYRYENPRDLYDREPDNYYPERDRNLYSGNKQKRIIYYATLPDVSRTPPNVDLRDRYNYRDRFDDRYVNSAAGEPYHFRKAYPKSRYEDNERTKAPYPLKVSTDVNVREIKKNPERRIYSEVDRNRYAFKPTQYQNDRSA